VIAAGMLSLALVPASAAAAWSQPAARIVNEPQAFSGTLGDNPQFQDDFTLNLAWKSPSKSKRPYEIRLHYQTETLGRQDSSFDLDRAWIRLTDELTIGRIHPWDLSDHPFAHSPWSLAASFQAQNRGILLGDAFSESVLAFPEPTLLGWIGAHYFSESSRSGLSWGVSVSPLFVPSMGSAVSLSDDTAPSSGRFGRMPPGLVDVNGTLLPLSYRVDKSRILKDVILQPQVMLQAGWRWPFGQGSWRSFVSVSRQPVPGPEADASGFLKVSSNSVSAVAEVEPKFPERFLASFTQSWRPGLLDPKAELYASALARDDRSWGYELGVRSRNWKLSYSDQPGRPATSTGGASVPEDVFCDHLLQGEIRMNLGAISPYVGAMSHLTESGDAWIRSGMVIAWAPRAFLDVGFELFGGDDLAYFGQWRSNDRIRMAVGWAL
jgi:hypothetical protein